MSKFVRKLLSVCLTVLLLLSFTLSDVAYARTPLTPSFGPPPTIPPNEHPRVMFRASDIPNIRANMASAEGAYAVTALNTLLNGTTFNGNLPARGSSASNANYTGYATVEAYAFDYVLNKDDADPLKAAAALANGNKAITAMKNIIATFQYNPTASDIVREKGMIIYLSALVYDWCFPLMTATDKALFVAKTEELAATIDGMGGWPIQFQNGLNGHINETHILRDLLAFSIASYDEYPDIYNFVGGYVQDTYVPSKNWWYQSGSYHQGLGYNAVRFQCDLWAQFLFNRMNGTKLFSDDMAKVPYMLLYNNRPDKRSLPEGDTNADPEMASVPTWIRDDMPNLLYASSIYGDGYLKGEYQTYSNNFNYLKYNSFFPQLSPVNFLIVNNPDVTPLSKSVLPKTRTFGSPNGLMVARTGLNEGLTQPDAIAWAKIGETYPGNHAHLDSGTFQIYYKGPLAIDGGKYDAYATPHDANYAKETISHNGLLIYDPSETTKAFSNIPAPINSGGQRRKATDEAFTYDNLISDTYHMGDVLGMAVGNDPINPEFSYISGDITPAYSSNKVSEVRRSMMFMPTNNAQKPAIFVVMDKVVSTNPNFKKTFLLHSHQEPTVNGNVTTIVRNTMGYNGKLTVQTLYPKNPTIEKVGGLGKQFWVVDHNEPPTKGSTYSSFNSLDATLGVNNVPKGLQYGWGRVEVSPSTAEAEDYFLNVMYVSDADNTSPVDHAELIETPDLLGARILDKVNIFAKNKERLDKDLTFTVPGNGSVAVAVAGVNEGQWTIVDSDGHTQTQAATEQGGVVYFTGPAGTYTMTQHPVDKNALLSTLTTAATKVESNYTLASWNAFAEKLAAAQTLNSRADATQQEVDAANSGLILAMNGLVTKLDTSAPTLKLSVNKPVIEENNHKMVQINVSLQADGTGTGIASIKLISITSNEPDNGQGDGNTTNDIQDAEFGTNDTSFSLRAERSGKGSGRIYTITYTATDLAGNTTTASTQVVVPK